MTSKLKYSIIGASGHAGVIIDELIKIDSSVDIILFDDNLDQKCIDYSVSGSIDDLILQRPGDGLSYSFLEYLIGKKAKRDLRKGHKINIGDLNWLKRI